MITIAVANQKGGVGKTTTAVNLSAYLAAAGKNVLLVDLDPQANASSGLGIFLKPGEPSSYNLVMNASNPRDLVRETKMKRLHIIPASLDLVGCEIELGSDPEREYRLKKALNGLKYDYCIVDCPPSLGILTVNALVAARWVIIPVQCEYYALEGLSRLIRTIELVKVKFNPDLEIAGFLFTMFDSRTRISKEVVEEVRSHFRNLCFSSVIPRNVRLSEAPSYGLPVLLYDAKSSGAVAYQKLAVEVMKRCKNA